MYTTPLLTDFYELTMGQGYFLNKQNPRVVFDMQFRRQPFGSGFSVLAGIEPLIDRLVNLSFSEDDLDYLESQSTFKPAFLDYLKNYKFSGDLYAMDEGSLVFPEEPLIRIHSNLIEAQLIESLLLNIVNFQTLIATKSARIYNTAKGGKIQEFGLRRAQGIDGALSAARAAYIGGVSSTSNTMAGKDYGIPVSGTMAHSWVMTFDDELEAFRSYADLYPENTILLIDTYDTLGCGIENAITVGLEQKKKGRNIGVRLDSGDLQYLSVRVRKKLDDAGLNDAIICVSNDLNEEVIWQLVSNNAPIDLWGVGTQLVTGGCDSSLTGVYKLAARQVDGNYQPTIKVSNNPEKITNPGIKQVYRFYDENKSPLGDLISCADEELSIGGPIRFNHPMYRYKSLKLESYHSAEPLLRKRISGGKICEPHPPIKDIRSSVIEQMEYLDPTHKRLINPHIYKVSLSDKLRDLKFGMIDERLGN
ncbi:MAG: nicotinate phosphoribosyltransferase [Spirochaetales bacterium]|nr:nicotinate phosphoribosyltransferase [Spirochaetales bacterium]